MTTLTLIAADWPALRSPEYRELDETERALRDRDLIRRDAERRAWREGHDVVRITDCHGATLDAFPLDERRFRPSEGSRLEFPSRSAPGLTRYGTALRVTVSRVLVAYKFKRRDAKPKWVSVRLVRVLGRS